MRELSKPLAFSKSDIEQVFETSGSVIVDVAYEGHKWIWRIEPEDTELTQDEECIYPEGFQMEVTSVSPHKMVIHSVLPLESPLDNAPMNCLMVEHRKAIVRLLTKHSDRIQYRVPTSFDVFSMEALETLMNDSLTMGFEELLILNPHAPYGSGQWTFKEGDLS